MIRKLSQQDHEKTFAFLKREPSINLFIIGDIEVFGYESDFQELWGDFDDSGELRAVLLRFYQSFIPYAVGEFDLKGYTEIIQNFGDTYYLSGKTAIVEQFESMKELKLDSKQVTYFAECLSPDRLDTNDLYVQKATLDDVDDIIALRKTIEEFRMQENARDMLVKAMETNTGRTYFTMDDGKMTACASTTAENSISAMVVGVCTHKDYRGRGLATAIMEKLFTDVMAEGKTLCLFYDNPAAGRIYKRLGFKDIGQWTMYR